MVAKVHPPRLPRPCPRPTLDLGSIETATTYAAGDVDWLARINASVEA